MSEKKQTTLEDFLFENINQEKINEKNESKVKQEKKNEINQDEKKQQEQIEENLSLFTQKTIKTPKNEKQLFLLDVQYSPGKNKALLKLIDTKTNDIYYWIDNTGHKPYLITNLKPEEILTIKEVSKSKNFIGIEKITRKNLLYDKTYDMTRVIGSNPLAIGGRHDSFRQFINPSYEADIRYHLNYICDLGLTPGTFLDFENGYPKQALSKIDKKMEHEIEQEFQNESEEEKQLLKEYMPLLFSPMPSILRAAIDIEVEPEQGRMPNLVEAKQPIISIALADTKEKRIVWVLERKGMSTELNKDEKSQVLFFKHEKDMLISFFSIIPNYPIILTFNGDNFDIPYLIKRAINLGIEEDKIPFEIRNKEGLIKKGGVHVDLYQFFKQAAIKVYAFGNAYESASLDELAHALLGEQKVEINKQFGTIQIAKLVEYNIKDAELTLGLTTFNNGLVMNLIFTLQRITKMPLHDFIRNTVSTWIRNWFIFEHRKSHLLVPNKEDILSLKGTISTKATIKGKKYQGAIVIQPSAGIWWNVYVMDFASLYPSLIKVKNLSYETINCTHKECQQNRVPETTHWICTKKRGFVSTLVGFIRDIRVNWFKPKSKDKNLPEKVRQQYNVIQASLKVLINASYGVLGAEYFSFYCPPVAESTAAFARFAITKTKEFCEKELGLKVLYGDTDSVFLLNPSPEQIKKLEEWSKKELNIDLGIDYIFKYVVLSDRKKNYFGVTKNGKIIVKGLLGKKRNTPPLVRKVFNNVLEILKKVENEEDLEKAKKQIINEIRNLLKTIKSYNFELEDIAINQTISQNPRNYKAWTPVLQALAQLITQGEEGQNLGEGTNIAYVPVKPFRINISPDNKILPKKYWGTQICTVKPIQLVRKKQEIDLTKIIETVQSTFAQILETLGISWDEIEGTQSIDQWF